MAKAAPIGAGLPDYPAHVFPSAEAGAIIGGLTGGAIGGTTGVAFGMGVGCVAGLPFLIVGCPVGAILGGTIGFAIGTTVGSVAGVVLGASDGIARQLPPPAQATVAAPQDPVPQQVALDSRSTQDSAPIEKAGIDLSAIDAQIQAGVRQVREALGLPSSAAG
ncbi:hypothetical protein [Nocardia sp. NPDC052316]|uniref:hypothetical protein n=1 Tax=Nocardia sp. NPDC052316 TaxID=3364329 RepID=UPI0037C722C9